MNTIRAFIPCDDHLIPMVIDYPEGNGPFPCILMLHGFMSFKDGDGFMLMKTSERLVEQGIATARIDFCSMGENRKSRVDYGTEICVKEAKTSFEYLQSLDSIISDRIGILGHSMGGRITFLSANLPSKLLISYNGAVNVSKVTPFKMKNVDMEMMNDLGFCLVHTSDGRTELLFPKFVEDCQIASDDIYKYTNPILVCVGAADPTLDPNVSYNFVKECGMDNVEMIVIEGANHTFNAKTGDYTKLNELLDKLTPWVVKNL